jgi:hypothetical protein
MLIDDRKKQAERKNTNNKACENPISLCWIGGLQNRLVHRRQRAVRICRVTGISERWIAHFVSPFSLYPN